MHKSTQQIVTVCSPSFSPVFPLPPIPWPLASIVQLSSFGFSSAALCSINFCLIYNFKLMTFHQQEHRAAASSIEQSVCQSPDSSLRARGNLRQRRVLLVTHCSINLMDCKVFRFTDLERRMGAEKNRKKSRKKKKKVQGKGKLKHISVWGENR